MKIPEGELIPPLPYVTGGVPGHSYIQGIDWGPTADDVYLNAQPPSNGFNQHVFCYGILSGVFTQITQDVQPQHSFAPIVSPDGSRIAFGRMSRSDIPEKNVFTMDRNCTSEAGLVQLTFDEGPVMNVTPDWVGGGDQIVYCSDRTGSYQIWLINSDGTDDRMLSGSGNNLTPSWGPIP